MLRHISKPLILSVSKDAQRTVRGSPFAEHAMSVSSRRARVSARFGDTTQWITVCLRPGGIASKYAHAFATRRIARSSAGASDAASRSNE